MAATSKVRKKRKWGKIFEYTSHSRQLQLDSESRATAEDEILKMRVITPSAVASRYDIRVSTAKRLLENLQQRGQLQLIVDTRRLKVYETVK